MDELEISKIVGVGCAAMLAFVGLSEVSHGIVSMDDLDEPAYPIEVAGTAKVTEEAIPVSTIMASADAAAGEKMFKACKACHNAADGAASKVGPNLWGIVGRDVASVEGFGYSNVLEGMDGAWDWEALNAFLKSPKGYAKGTKMAYNGIKKDADRANLMAWLNEQSGAPMPMPTE